jgi:hypothetical protein
VTIVLVRLVKVRIGYLGKHLFVWVRTDLVKFGLV